MLSEKNILLSEKHERLQKNMEKKMTRGKFVTNRPKLIDNVANSRRNSLSFNIIDGEIRYMRVEEDDDKHNLPSYIPSHWFAIRKAKGPKHLTL